MLKEKYCEEVKVINILGYELEVINILDFKLFYDSCTSFNSFSKKAFLKAVKIPPQYFLEQPEDTQEDLLLNKLDFIPSSKLHGQYLAILKKDNNVLNCVRVDKNELENLDERISLSEINSKKLNFIKDFVKEGYSSNFVSLNKEKEGEYNLGIFIDYPLMLNKKPLVNKGFYYIPKKGEDNYKNLYIEDGAINFEEYHSLDLLIEDIDNILLDTEKDKVLQPLKDKHLLREIDEVLTKLYKEKVISRAIFKGIIKYTTKNNTPLNTLFSLIDLILLWEANVNNYKSAIKIRNCTKILIDTLQ